MQTYQTRLRQLREDQDKTQKEIAAYLGINQTVYSRYETGKNDMKPFQIIALCEYYQVSADYLLGLPKNLPYGLGKTK
ncbi:MAG: helix-turn-helix transcriptional regulator [Oscillospiraceae bacterium]|nr:helix-turn-helix transcriptional regulator [Oscillospiraceae bacterium]